MSNVCLGESCWTGALTTSTTPFMDGGMTHTHTGCYRGFAPPAAEFSTYRDQKSNAESDQFSELAQKRRIVKQLW